MPRTQKQRKRRATQIESDVARAFGGRRTPCSGAGLEKADAVVPHRRHIGENGIAELSAWGLRIECKTTESDRYTLKAQEWYTLVKTALNSGELPVFFVQLKTTTTKEEAVVLQSSLYDHLFIPGLPLSMRKSYTITSSLVHSLLDKIPVGIHGAFDPITGNRSSRSYTHFSVTSYFQFWKRVVEEQGLS